MGLPEMPQRLGCGTETLEVSLAGDTSIVATETDYMVRCARCRHPLTARRSVELRLGPICRREVAA